MSLVQIPLKTNKYEPKNEHEIHDRLDEEEGWESLKHEE
jgi:hypothetical protein